MWIDQGSIASPMTAAFHFAYSYQLNVLLIGYERKQIPLVIAMLHWLRVQQPDLLTPNKDAISFDVDFMDNATVLLQFQLRVSAQVTAVRREAGGCAIQIRHAPDALLAYAPPPPEGPRTETAAV